MNRILPPQVTPSQNAHTFSSQVFAVDASNPDEVRPRITPLQRLSTLPEGFTERNYVGEIK